MTNAYDPEALGKRLRKELARTGWEIPDFAREIERRCDGATGSSRPTIYRYVMGGGRRSGPGPVVLGAMADTLGVSADYLLEDGPGRTDAERAEWSGKLREAAVTTTPTLFQVLSGEVPELHALGVPVATTLIAYLDRWANDRGLFGDAEDADQDWKAVIEHAKAVMEWARRFGEPNEHELSSLFHVLWSVQQREEGER